MTQTLRSMGPVRTLAPTTPAPTTVTTGATRSLVALPAVVAHRGASGHRPEHTLDAFRTAIRMGADQIELDLVISADGVLLVRHENELSRSTDVARHPRFARRCATRCVDGVATVGWFTEDFTLAEIKQLGACERRPRLRPDNTAYDGLEGVPTLDEVLAMVAAESIRAGRQVGVMLELKHPSHFAARGLEMVTPLLATLRRHGLDGPWAPVTLMAFETGVLHELALRSGLATVQLLGRPHERPWDLAAAGDPRTYADLASPAGLEWIDAYADGIGAHKDLVLPPESVTASHLVGHAHSLGLTVHVWTLRAENLFLVPAFRIGEDPSAVGDLGAEVRAFLDAGVDGVITDHPDVAVVARTTHMADHGRQQAG